MNNGYIIVKNPQGDNLAVFESFEEAIAYCAAPGGLLITAYRIQLMPKEGV